MPIEPSGRFHPSQQIAAQPKQPPVPQGGPEQAALRAAQEALLAAKAFITNGVVLGFIRMPDSETPDPAKATPAKIDHALAEINKVFGAHLKVS